MSKIIISYRRASYDAIAGRIRDKLAVQYGGDAVYMDVDNIPFGTDFREHIDKALTAADVVVAIIGPKWLGPNRGRKPRIFDDLDPVRIEIETAFRHGIEVVPILVDGAKMPKPEELPDNIGQLAYRNAAIVDGGRDFHQHMDRLIRSMNALLSARSTTSRNWRWPVGLAAGVVVAAALVLGAFFTQPRLSQWFTKTPGLEVRAIDTTPSASPSLSASVGKQASQPPGATSATIGKHVALVIGNASYKEAPTLGNSVNDAIAISDMFRSLGYSVITRTNIGKAAFSNALRAFADEAENAEIAVIYYSGHAVEISGAGYLVPTDVHLAGAAELIKESVSLDTIIAAADGAAQLRLILLDACRDNPFTSTSSPAAGTRSIAIPAGSIRSKRDELTDLYQASLAATRKLDEDKLNNTLIAYAAKSGQTAEDGDGPTSPFSSALVKYLATPNLDIRLALGRVRDEVFKVTKGRQEPFYYGSLGGETVSLAPQPASPK